MQDYTTLFEHDQPMLALLLVLGLWVEEFPPYPGATTLGYQCLMAPPSAISVTTYASQDSPERVQAFYHKRYPQQVGPQFRAGDRLLAIYPADSTDYPAPEHPPLPTDKTVILVSVMTRLKN